MKSRKIVTRLVRFYIPNAWIKRFFFRFVNQKRLSAIETVKKYRCLNPKILSKWSRFTWNKDLLIIKVCCEIDYLTGGNQ